MSSINYYCYYLYYYYTNCLSTSLNSDTHCYCPRKGDIASHEIGRKELKFFVFSSALPKSFFSFLASLTARGENHRGRVLLEKYRADVDM